MSDSHSSDWTQEDSVFCYRSSKDKIDPFGDFEPESMGDADIKYSESLVVLQHVNTGLWVTYQDLVQKRFFVIFEIFNWKFF